MTEMVFQFQAVTLHVEVVDVYIIQTSKELISFFLKIVRTVVAAENLKKNAGPVLTFDFVPDDTTYDRTPNGAYRTAVGQY